MYAKILQKLLQEFFLTKGRGPMNALEWSKLRKQAMELAAESGNDPITGTKIQSTPKSLMDTTKDLPTKDVLTNRPNILPFPKQKSRNMTPLKRAMNTEGIRGLMMKGNVRLGEAPKTLKSTLDSKKAAYQGHINKEMWVKDKMQQNKDAIKRFKDKFLKNEPKTVEDFRDKGDWDPSGMAYGGIAPLVGEPSYAADFYDDRTPMAGGSIVKGGRWFLNNLKKALKDIEADKGFKNLTPERKEGLTSEIKNLIKSVEGGGPIPDEMIQTIRHDPKFAEISKTRSTDPDLYEFEDLILNYGKKGDVVDEQVQILEKFDPTDRLPNNLGGRVSYSGGGLAGLPPVTSGMSMQGPQMPAGPQPAGISGANLQMNQMNLNQDRNQMMQSPYMPTGGQPYGGQLRMPFAGGGMGRRAFMKLMAGLAALPFVGKGITKVAPKAAPKIAETVATAGSGTGMPAWFPSFVQKVLKKGDDITDTAATQERMIVAETKLPHSDTPVYVEHDLVTGDTTVDIGMGKHGWSDGYNGQPTRLILKKGEIIEEGKMKGQKTPDEFVVEEAEFTGGHPENIKFEESSFNNYGEHGSDFSELEEFATGKVSKGSKAQKQVWEADWDDSLPDSEDFASGGIARLGFNEGKMVFGQPKKMPSGGELIEEHTDYIKKANELKQADEAAKKAAEKAKYSDLLKYDTGNEIRPDMDMLLRQAMQYVPEKERKLVDTMIAELLLIYPDKDRPTTINEVKQLINQAKIEGKFEKKLFNEKLALSATKILDTAQDKTLLSIKSPILNISGDVDSDTYNLSKDLKLGNVNLGYDTTFAEGDQIGSTYSAEVPIKYKDLEGDLEVKRRDNKYNTTDSVDFDTELKKGDFTAGLTGNVEKDKYGITTALEPSLNYNLDTDYGTLSASAKKNIIEGGDWKGNLSYSIGDSGHPAEEDQYWRLSANLDPVEGDKKAMLLFKSKFAKGGLARLLGE